MQLHRQQSDIDCQLKLKQARKNLNPTSPCLPAIHKPTEWERRRLVELLIRWPTVRHDAAGTDSSRIQKTP